ncbi:ileal sodium/bile acid cotransporter-like isoform X2 [Patiria miniata]|nr:ileal sodium/bile acid cotransporter-like isoform X2 [Patiria miniata]
MAGGCVKIFGVLVLVLALVVDATVVSSENLQRNKRQVTKPTNAPKTAADNAGDSKENQPPATKKSADKKDKTITSPAGDSSGTTATIKGVSRTNDTTTTTTVVIPATVVPPAKGGCVVPKPEETENANLTLSFDESPMYIHEGEIKNLTIFYSGLRFPRVMHLKTSDESMFIVISNDTVPLETTAGDDNDTVTVTLHGVRLGITKLQILILDPRNPEAEAKIFTHLVKTKRVLRIIDTMFDYMLLPLVLIATCGMGCKLDTDLIKGKLRRPIPVFVGPVCQFICMPLVALSISKLFKFDPLTAMGLITVGSCPGGGLSNMITLLVDADLIMSVTMTFLSTCLALGMLPLNLFIYSRFFKAEGNEDSGINLPITNIIMQISFLTVPLLLGMLIRAKLPKIAEYVIKSLNILSLTLVLLTLGVGLYSNVYVIFSPAFVLLGGFLHPTCGFIIGFIMAKFLARFPNESAVTVSVETGVQNNLIAISMLKLSFDQPEADIMARMPMIVAISAVSIGIGMILASIPINRRRSREEKRAKELRNVTDKYDYQPVALTERRLSDEQGNGDQPAGNGVVEQRKESIPSYDLVVVERPPVNVDGPETVV